ncbi:MAG TPA: iron-containing alcohol dehydrogenase [Actinomycetota bacterium]|nr:iron-containing alcohol dehydrogenase [Actinomycetota bacterium]
MPDFPEVVAYDADDDEFEAAAELARQLHALEIDNPLVIASVKGRDLAAQIEGPRPPEVAISDTDQDWASQTGALAREKGADAIVAVGGGRCLDVAKLAAARAGVVNIAVPTQLSHDGICSPVAVVPNDQGRSESLGAAEPRLVFLSLPTLIKAPAESAIAGVGDLIANPLALRDWALAAKQGLEDIDQRAWDLSVESFELIERDLDRSASESAADPSFHRRLADALILSGMAMIVAGTSRPASGSEHEISHAIDGLLGGRALHGAQVAFGCIFSVALYGEDTEKFRERLRMLGLPQHPSELGISEPEVLEVLLAAPDTRPGRFGILEDANLDRGSAEALVRKIWSE